MSEPSSENSAPASSGAPSSIGPRLAFYAIVILVVGGGAYMYFQNAVNTATDINLEVQEEDPSTVQNYGAAAGGDSDDDAAEGDPEPAPEGDDAPESDSTEAGDTEGQ